MHTSAIYSERSREGATKQSITSHHTLTHSQIKLRTSITITIKMHITNLFKLILLSFLLLTATIHHTYAIGIDPCALAGEENGGDDPDAHGAGDDCPSKNPHKPKPKPKPKPAFHNYKSPFTMTKTVQYRLN